MATKMINGEAHVVADRDERYAVSYRRESGDRYYTVGTHRAGETYVEFCARMSRPGFDWPWSDCRIEKLTSAVRDGHLPHSVL